MTREQKIARARRLRDEGMLYAQIADEVGASAATVYRWLNPEYAERQRAKARAWKEANREAKRAYDREYNATHKGTCSNCRGPMDRDRDGGVCQQCRHDEAHERYAVIEQLWNEGKTRPEICRALGVSDGLLSLLFHRARAEGYLLPYRYTTGKRAGRKFPRQRAA